MEKYINPYTDLDWDIANGMDAAEKKGIEKGEKIGMEKGRAEGRTEGRVEGRAEGAHAQAIETARRLKAKGTMSVAEIADITGLTPGEIAAIQPENK